MPTATTEVRFTPLRLSSKPAGDEPRVLFIASFPPPSAGVSNVMQGFWDSSLHDHYALRRLNITRREPAHVRGRLRLNNVISTAVQWARAFWICLKWQPCIVNVVYTSYFATIKAMGFALIGRLCRARVLGHLHGGAFDKVYRQQNRLVRKLIRLSLGPVNAWIVTATYWRDLMVSWGVDESRITVIPNPQRVEVFRQPPKNDYRIQERIPRLLFVGAVSRRKGVDILIEALSLLINEGSVFQVYMVGGEENPGEKAGLQALCQSRSVEGYFEFVERLEGEAYFDLLRFADIFVFPSRNENYPMALCEAMAVGLPVVSTPVGGIPDLVTDNENGLLVPSEDAVTLALALRVLASDVDLRTRLGQAARTTVLSLLRPEQAAEALHVAFHSLCGGNCG